jgi:hypothetical protein
MNYPRCDNYNCWYKSNPDRIGEYDAPDKPITYVVSDDIEYDVPSRPPCRVKLCDMCEGGAEDYCCSCCGKRMYDSWIELSEPYYIHICRECVDSPAILARLPAGIELPKWPIATAYDMLDDPAAAEAIIAELAGTRKMQIETERAHRRARKAAARDVAVGRVAVLFEIPEASAMRVVDRLGVDNVPATTDRTEFILNLIDRD